MRKIASIVLCLASVFLAFEVRAEELDLFPAGAKLVLQAKQDLRFSISAAAPSVLWLTAEGAPVRSLTVKSRDGSAIVSGVNGRAECAIPINSVGNIEVAIRCSGQGSVAVTSYYGIGEIVDTFIANEVIAAKPAVAEPPPPPARETSPVAARTNVETKPIASTPVSQPPPAAQPTPPPQPAPSTQPAPVPQPTPSTQPAPLVPSPASPAPPAPPADPNAIIHSAVTQNIFIGEWATGVLTSKTEVKTFRLYVPNRSAFTVEAVGSFGIRVQSRDGVYDKTDVASVQKKVISIPFPSEGRYLISIKGEGSFAIRAEIVK